MVPEKAHPRIGPNFTAPVQQASLATKVDFSALVVVVGALVVVVGALVVVVGALVVVVGALVVVVGALVVVDGALVVVVGALVVVVGALVVVVGVFAAVTTQRCRLSILAFGHSHRFGSDKIVEFYECRSCYHYNSQGSNDNERLFLFLLISCINLSQLINLSRLMLHMVYPSPYS